MRHAVTDLGAFGVVEPIHRTNEVARDAPDALESHSNANQLFGRGTDTCLIFVCNHSFGSVMVKSNCIVSHIIAISPSRALRAF